MFNILVCDDDKEIVDSIDIYLSQEGYHILKAYDGLQAIGNHEKRRSASDPSGYYDAESGWDPGYA